MQQPLVRIAIATCVLALASCAGSNKQSYRPTSSAGHSRGSARRERVAVASDMPAAEAASVTATVGPSDSTGVAREAAPRAPASAPGSRGGASVERLAPVPPARARLLTAASVADVDRFDNYLSYLSRHRSESEALGIRLDRRLRVRVVDSAGKPVNDARITVAAAGFTASGRTHADGRWDLLDGRLPQAGTRLAITAKSGDQAVRAFAAAPRAGSSREQRIQLGQAKALAPAALDLAFAVDVTGSMGDELRYITREVSDIVRRTKAAAANLDVRVGAVLYRDRGDLQPLQRVRFTRDVSGFRRLLARVHAGGGGDYPEDMSAGLHAAMRQLKWREGNVVRVLVLLADAPPKRYSDAQYDYRHAMRAASHRGIRILPVAASGANRTVEYLFRAMGAVTSTPYVYLTDDSGIGAPHMEADTDRVGVERFNELLTRLLIADLRGQGMHEPGALRPHRQLVGMAATSRGQR